MERIDVEWFEQLQVEHAVSLMRTFGQRPTLTLYAFGADDGSPVPFLGSVRCRPTVSAQDALDAMEGMGETAATIGAERIVLLWENRSLHWLTSAQPISYPTMLVTADVTRDRHVLTIRPFEERQLPPSLAGRIFPAFDHQHVSVNDWWPLPEGPADAARAWRDRKLIPGAVPDVTRKMMSRGYSIDWTDRVPA